MLENSSDAADEMPNEASLSDTWEEKEDVLARAVSFSSPLGARRM
jgi:hypothetical protein